MLRKLRDWARELSTEETVATAEDAEERERRLDARHKFVGAKFVVRNRRTLAILHLKDLSCKGACGITDLPVSVGSIVFVQINKPRFHAAEIRWVRNTLVGMQFFRPLQPDTVEKLHAAHLKNKARAG